MRLAARGFLLVILAARAAGAQPAGQCEPLRILYAAQSSAARIDAYRLGRRGSIEPTTPWASVQLARNHRHGLLVNPVKNVLYVGERDRVEAFRLGQAGGIRRIACEAVGPSETGHSATEIDSTMHPRGLAVSTDGRTLYVTQRGRDRLAAYALGEDGMLERGALPDTCVPGRIRTKVDAGYQDVAVHGTLVYVSEDGFTDSRRTGRIDIFQTLQEPEASALGFPVGSLCPEPSPEPCMPLACATASTTTTSTSSSTTTSILSSTSTSTSTSTTTTIRAALTRLRRPRNILIDPVESILYVEERGFLRVKNYQLDPTDGLFVVPPGESQAVTASKTRRIVNHDDIVLHRIVTANGETQGLLLIGSQFFRGEIEAFGVKVRELGDVDCDLPIGVLGCLPGRPTSVTSPDLFMSPVGLTTDRRIDPTSGQVRDTIYVSGGDLDRVRAYRIRTNRRGKLIVNPVQFSETKRQRQAFPNAVAIAVFPRMCE